MKTLFLLLAIPLLCNCASTTVWERDNRGVYHKVFQTQADIDQLTFRSDRTALVATRVNHSEPMKAEAIVVKESLSGATNVASVISHPASPWAAIASAVGDVMRSWFSKK